MRLPENKFSKVRIILYVAGLVPVTWIAMLAAPAFSKGGVFEIFRRWHELFSNPFRFVLCDGSVKTVVIFILVYLVGLGIYLSTESNFRRREEHGSAKWGSAAALNRTYADKEASKNKILTQNVRIGFDGHAHRRNLNTMVVGGSGSGKTRFYCKPNLLQATGSYFVIDPKGEMVRSTGNFLKDQGYDVRVLDLINLDRSASYNPFVYLENDEDIQRLTTNIILNTTPKGSQTSDPFWDQAASMLLKALMFYLYYEAPKDEQNFPMLMEMIRAGDVKENDDDYESPLDILFERLEEKDPEHIALKYYRAYHSGAAQTLKSIQISLIARLEKFNIPSVADISIDDDLRLEELGEKPGVIFAVIPDNDSSFNFIIGMVYTQLFQQLYRCADFKYGGALPYHVHFLCDELANCGIPSELEKIFATCRSRNISISAVLQNISQLKALFEKQWESIIGNCDEFLYLGGNEQSTHKYVSELIGKETIDTNSYGQQKGRNGSYSKNDQVTGRDLMTPDEVRRLENNLAILFIRGENPVIDYKFDILRHPNVVYTTDGSGKPYIHGRNYKDATVITLIGDDAKTREKAINIDELFKKNEGRDINYEIHSTDEDLDEIYLKLEEKNNEEDS